jgi:hypothetical protein
MAEMTPEGVSAADRKLIKSFVENEQMFDAVRRVLLQGIIKKGTGAVAHDFANRNWIFNINMDLDDATFGREVKITTEAMRWIEKGCDELKQLAKPAPVPSTINTAR